MSRKNMLTARGRGSRVALEMNGLRVRGEMKDTDAIVNRHMARLLGELEDAGCPALFREAVKSKLVWLRQDLKEQEERPDDERPNRN